MKKIFPLSIVVLIALCFANPAKATTWAPKEVECPNCKTKNTFKEIMSYGTYIYQWPSKFEYIFWPLTDSPVLYCCLNCHLTAFMWDFENIPKDKFSAVQKHLDQVKLEGSYDEYTKIPMSRRLAIAEKVYLETGKDDQFWCLFYRVLGYHLEAERLQSQADEARSKALKLAEKLTSVKENESVLKELLLISGAMKHFLKDDEAALKDLRQAQGLKFENPKLQKEASANVDSYLTELLTEYIQKISKEQKPKT